MSVRRRYRSGSGSAIGLVLGLVLITSGCSMEQMSRTLQDMTPRMQQALTPASHTADSGASGTTGAGQDAGTNASAALSERVEVTQVGNETTLRLRDFDTVAVQQQEDVWCWAACAEMILRYDGQPASQASIAERIMGAGDGQALKIQAASRYEVYRALCPEIEVEFDSAWDGLMDQVDRAGEATILALQEESEADVDWNEDAISLSFLEDLFPGKGVPVDELRQGYPAVVGLRDAPGADLGHVYVLVGVTYTEPDALSALARQALQSRSGGGPSPVSQHALERFGPGDHVILAVELIDPWEYDDPETEGNDMRVRLDFEDVRSRIDFVTTRSDAAAALSRWGNLGEVSTSAGAGS